MKKLVSVCARTEEIRPTSREITHNAMRAVGCQKGTGMMLNYKRGRWDTKTTCTLGAARSWATRASAILACDRWLI